MTAPTERDRDRAELWCQGHTVLAPTFVAQLIADVRAEERERGEAERALLAASVKQLDTTLRESVKAVAQGLLAIQRAEAAEQKLAELVRWVREWESKARLPMVIESLAELRLMLPEYDSKPEGP